MNFKTNFRGLSMGLGLVGVLTAAVILR